MQNSGKTSGRKWHNAHFSSPRHSWRQSAKRKIDKKAIHSILFHHKKVAKKQGIKTNKTLCTDTYVSQHAFRYSAICKDSLSLRHPKNNLFTLKKLILIETKRAGREISSFSFFYASILCSVVNLLFFLKIYLYLRAKFKHILL